MFQLDDNLLQELGLGTLPADEKGPFLQVLYKKLEDEVGLRLSHGMTPAQLSEFEAIFDRDETTIRTWLERYAPNYQEDRLFHTMQQASGLDNNHPSLLGEYTATKWLEVNRPDYREIVSSTLDGLKQQIIQQRDAILGTA